MPRRIQRNNPEAPVTRQYRVERADLYVTGEDITAVNEAEALDRFMRTEEGAAKTTEEAHVSSIVRVFMKREDTGTYEIMSEKDFSVKKAPLKEVAVREENDPRGLTFRI